MNDRYIELAKEANKKTLEKGNGSLYLEFESELEDLFDFRFQFGYLMANSDHFTYGRSVKANSVSIEDFQKKCIEEAKNITT